MQNKAVLEGYQLSPQQTHIWLLQQADDNQAYGAQSAVFIEGDLDVRTLADAISDVVNRHEILRASFHLLPEMTLPLQTIGVDQVAELRETDLNEYDTQEKLARVEGLFRKEAIRRFDLKHEPITRFRLYRLSPSESVLLMSLPALCADSHSLKILFREIARAYAARLRGEDLRDRPVQYVDFAEWQREMLEQADSKDETWDGLNPHFTSALPIMLGLERASNTVFGCSPDCVSFLLDAETTTKVDRISSAHNVTPDVFLLACWQILVWRLSGRKDITIDYLYENRRLRGLRESVGAFARFCQVQSHLEPDYQFVETLEIVDQSIKSASQRLDHLLRKDSAGTLNGRLAERANAICFEYEEWPKTECIGSVKFSYWKQFVCVDRFKLKLGVYRKTSGLTIEIQYDPAFFSHADIELIEERCLRLIEGAVEDEHALIGDLELIGRRELERLLTEWNETENRFHGSRCIHELIAEQSSSRPESIAVLYKEEQLSYRELESRSNQLANHLCSLGVGPDCVVGLCLERSAELVTGLLGILKAGGAYLPLEVGQPVERLASLLEEAGAAVVVMKQSVAESLPVGRYKVVMLDLDQEQIESCSRMAPNVEVKLENLASVIYTSGSSGEPKGVMVKHGSVVNLLEGLEETIYRGEAEGLTVSMNAPLAVDASVKQVIQLGRGCRLCIVPEEGRTSTESMLEYISRNGIEALDCMPSQLRTLVEAGLGKVAGEPKIVLIGGEATEGRNWKEISDASGIRRYRVYGPTEYIGGATTCEAREGGEQAIGRPINNTRIYILDEKGRAAPMGMVGDIYIGGVGSARGYLGKAGLTAEYFVPDPFGGRRGERLYRTGDIGRYLTDGKIVYEGRRDRQVNGRGYRRIGKAAGTRGKEEAPPLVKAPRDGQRTVRLPLSFAQQRLWFLAQIEPDSPVYNMPNGVRLKGGLDIKVLERVINEIVRRHEVLRTRFEAEDGEPVQVIEEWRPRRLEVEDLSNLTWEKREEVARQAANEEANTGFDLSRGPLLRVRILKLEEEEHVLLFTMHHIVSDGWSMGLLMREVGILYGAYLRNEVSPLPELPIQYADYAVWQREWLQGAALNNQLTYWKRQLAGTSRLELPTDKPRPSIQTYGGASESFTLPVTLTRDLRELSRREEATLFMTLLAGFKALLSRYSGNEEIVIGTDIANRNRAETEGLIGFFINQLVLRTDLSGEPSFRQLIGRVREVCLGAYAHQDLPFEKLVEELRPERSLSYTPLFQVSCTMNTVNGAEASSLPDIAMAPARSENQVANYDLTLLLTDRGEVIQGAMQYNTDLFEAATVKRMIGHLSVMLDAAVGDPEREVSCLQLMTAVEQRQILKEWNRTAWNYPREKCLHELFEEQVERTPDQIAVIFAEQCLSYRELNARANKIAHCLRGKGIVPEAPVGLCLERSLEMMVALLGALKSGGAYVPLDPEYPPERLRWMLEDAGVNLLLTEERVRARTLAISSWSGGEVLSLDEEWGTIAREPDQNVGAKVSSENLAYVLYTSGSTGRPKGAQIGHRGLVNYTLMMKELLGLGGEDRILQFAPLSFDVAAEEIYPALSGGATVVLARVDEMNDPAELHQVLYKNRVSVMELPAAYWHEWVNELDSNGGVLPPTLRLVMVGCEIPQKEKIEKWLEKGAGLLTVFGLTETTITNLARRIERDLDQGMGWREPGIGRPVANNEVYILNSKQVTEPVGVSGEIYIGGEGVGRGYQGRADLTAERFVPNPFSNEPGARLYRTGDIGRYRSNGEIDFQGRLDQQVKVRGYRIELGEIESLLCEQEGVEGAVAAVREVAPGDKRLVAYVVARKGGAVTVHSLRERLEKRVPEYMVPSGYVMMERLPLTPNGKVDRLALPPWGEERGEADVNYVAPRTAVEEIVVGIFKEALKVNQVGVGDNFFKVGGHSLLATQAISRVRKAFGIEIGVRSIFEEPTAEGLANRIVEKMRSGEKDDAPPLVRVPREGRSGARLPLSFAQQRLWFLDQLAPNNRLFNICGAVELEGQFDFEALKRVINEIVRRHEVLRTRIEMVEGEPVQVIDEWAPRRLEVEDLSRLPLEEREEEAGRIAKEEVVTGFDLSRGPLLRVKALKLEEERHVLLYTMHHIVSDGWSMGILIKEVGALYRAYSASEPSPLAELPIQYADFAVWQRAWLQGEALERELIYWRKQLQGMEALELPMDHPRPAARSYRGASRPFVVESELTEKLRALGQREGATLYMTLLAGLDLLLSRYSGQEDIALGTDIANRDRAEIEGLIGFFVNQLVLRVTVKAKESFRELLKRAREACLGAYAHQGVPFEKLVEELQPERDLGRSPLFQAKFIWENAPSEGLELGDVRLGSVGGAETHTAKLDLTVSVLDVDSKLVGAVIYSRDLFEAETIERLVNHYMNVLRGIVEDSDRSISELSLLSDQEREQILVEWNKTRRPYPEDRCVHELFREQASRIPEQIALMCKEQYLSYGELNRRANQLGSYLQGVGVGPEVVVGLCLERSVEMIVGLLGVLKAGGAYLPLDPEAPLERLSYLLEDAGAGVVLTERKLEKRLPSFWGQTLCLDVEWDRIDEEGEEEPAGGVEADNLAYMIYTSGSTGKPKGVMVRHRSLVNYTNEICRQLKLEEIEGGERALQFATVSTITADLGNTCIYPSLLGGGCLQVLSYGVATDGARYEEYLRIHPVDVLKIVPSHLSALLGAQTMGARMLPFRYLILGGEALSPELVERIHERGEGCEVINHYGPTETTIGSLTTRVSDKDENWRRSVTVPIGRPIANTKIYVLDRELNPVPVGAHGELYISGEGVARGYWGKPNLTADRFIPNLLDSEDGARLYRTGDVCRYQSDGRIEFIGRDDDQVKVRGFRIELGEIQAVLNEHRSVKQSIVVASDDERSGKRLVGYVVVEGKVTSAELKNYARERLPEYMAPSAIVMLEEMPLTANGKIDRKKLPLVKAEDRQPEHEHPGARTPIEEILVGIYEEVLKLDRVETSDNFFEIGGHSLLATQVISRVRKTFGVEIGVGSIFEKPTVKELARGIEEAIRAGKLDEAPTLVRVEREGYRGMRLPLSFSQQRLWFLDQLAPNNPFYNSPRAVRLEGKLDFDVLERVVNEIIRRHEVLRTRFEVENGEPAQVIDKWAPRRLERIDLTGLTREERETEARRMAKEEAETGFDLSRGPLLRVKILELEQDDHLALFNVHHIVSDAWSVGILIREFGALYQAFSAGEPSPLPELIIQYADYAVWQRNYFQGDVLDSQLSYWRKQLDGVASLELPLDYPRPAIATFRGAGMDFIVSEEVAEGFQALSRREGVTLFMSLLAAFQTLLMRYSGQEDIALGSPIANRTRAETEALIGFFTNTLVLRTQVEGKLSFQELMGRVREICLGAYAYQDMPFEHLVEQLQPERDLSRQPLFQVMLTLQNAPAERLGGEGLRLSNLEVPDETSKFDLFLSTAEIKNCLGYILNYNTDLFEATTIERMGAHFKSLLQGIVANPVRKLSELELLSPDERRQILYEWNRTAGVGASSRCVHQLVQEQAERTPEATAICFRGSHLSYRELDRRANRIAYRLRLSGVGPEHVVGICADRSVEMLLGVLGILKAGGAYLPLDSSYPQERLSFVLKDSGVNALVTQKPLAPKLSPYEGAVIWIEEDWGATEEEGRFDEGVEMDWESPAYVIYTSGSTGRPKGVAMVHRALTNLIRWQLEHPQLSTPPRTVQFTSLGFDVSFQEIFATWCVGGSLVLIDEDARRDQEKLWNALREEAVERLYLPFVALQQLAEAGEMDGRGELSLRRIITAGEALKLTPAVVKLMGRLRGCRLENQYGPTESHVVSAYILPESSEEWVKKLPPIGIPIANTEMYILDGHMEPAPVGVVGDLYISGAALARGYLNRAVQTAEKFIPDPFSEREGGRLYQTGDRARYLADGNIEFMGRKDDQVKVRGYRIELGEIEAVLSEAPGVRKCAAKVVRDETGNGYLVGYVVCGEGVVARESEFRSYLRQRLPEYMAPSVFVTLESLPMTPSGKVDRLRLPDPERKKLDESGRAVPRTAIEEIVLGFYEEVLNVEGIGTHENFFEIGGHSLLATRVISRIRSTFGVEIGVRSIFEEKTVERLAGRIEEVMRSGEKDESPSLVKVSRGGQKGVKLPLSFAQQRLWFLDQLAPNNPFYNLPNVVELNEGVRLEALERVINEIIRRHEVLRTRIEMVEGEPVQVIDEWAPRRLEVEDLSRLPSEEREEEAGRIAREEAGTGFDLSRGPLLRVKALKLEEERHVLLYTMHHIVSDGWSMGILSREVEELYRAYSAGEDSPLDELPIQYADFAVWQREWLQGEALENKLEYWRKQLAGTEALELPADRPRPAVQSYRGAGWRFVLEREVTEKLKRLSHREGATLFILLMAAFKTVLMRYSGETDVSVGTAIANRTRKELEGLIGFFVNTLVMRTDLEGNPSFKELIKREREVALGAYAHQEVPFEKLVEEINPERDLSRSPLFQIMMLLQNTGKEELEFERMGPSGGGDRTQMARFDLTVTATDVGRDLVIEMTYSRDLFEESTIKRLMGHYTNLLSGIVKEIERPISELSLLSDQEKEQIVVAWNQTGRPYPQDRRIHELFRDQVARTPEQIALVCEGQWVSYLELDRSANQLGHYLQRLSVGPEMVVGLCLERSIEMVVGILAVLKAGGAYVPLDPSYPPERLSYMIDDAKVSLMITQRHLLEHLPLTDARIVCLDAERERIREQSGSEPESEVIAENLAYVIYTSGSTGRPKGVMLAHKGLCNLVEVEKAAFNLGSQSRVLQFASLSFDASVWEIFGALTAGGSLHLRSRERLMPGGDLERVLREDQITTVTLPPTALAAMEEEEMMNLETVIAAGEACTAEIVERWGRGRRFFDAYGPTETTVCASMGECEAGSDRMPTIGRPIANTQVYILGPNQEVAPIGVKGELYVGGAGVARGYLGRAEMSADKFVPHQFSGEPGSRLYRTGDLARYLMDGNIEFIGREDEQVKVRGHRIELGEIESALNEHRLVKQSVVVAREDERGNKRLLGYVVGEEEATAAELKRHVRERLPEYMVPEEIMILPEIPVTSNGKIDRTQLPTPSEARQTAGERFVAPRDILELQLAQIWERVLGIRPISVTDNFFDLGGHSVLAVSLMTAIRKATGRQLPLSALFQGGTIERLGSMLRQEATSMSLPCLVELQASGSQPPLFLVHPAGGNVICYLELARCLGTDRPFYGFQTPGLYGERALYAKIEDMAAHYLEAMMTIQPEGPYLLGGWSFGGVVAYEMAQQLIAQGRQVGQLLMLDTGVQSLKKEAVEEDEGQVEDIDGDDAALLISMFGEALTISGEDLERFEGHKRIEYVLEKAASANLLPPDVDVTLARTFLKVYRTNVTAMRQHVLQAYPGIVTLFKTSTELTLPPSDELAHGDQIANNVQDPTKGWGVLAAGGVRVIDVPGDHYTLVEKPHVETLALRIRYCIDEAQAVGG